jgi:thiosulfate dehydrogenase [quinone] large subunit
LAQQPLRTSRIDQTELDRRTLLATGGAAAALSAVVLVGGGLVAGLGRLFGSSVGGSAAPALGSGATSTTSKSPANSTTTTSSPGSPSTTAPRVPPGTKIGPAKDVPVGGAASFQDPSSGDTSLVVQPEEGTFLAFDAVCPHAGCTVEYSNASRLFICPCHASEFNGHTGAVEVGPAQSGLMRLTIAEGSDGQLYVS